VSFAVTVNIAREHSSGIALRIDDIDSPRVRREYIDDIFRVVDWMGIDYTVGPRSPEDLVNWGQHARLDSYRAALATMQENVEATYACECTRASLASAPCVCSEKSVEFIPAITALRMRSAAGDDPVIWRRDGLPSYHLTSVIDDDLLGITLVVRGEDLVQSTTIQRELAQLLPGNSFTHAQVIHHPLIRDSRGEKLSKSSGAGAYPLALNEELRQDIEGHVALLTSGLSR